MILCIITNDAEETLHTCFVSQAIDLMLTKLSIIQKSLDEERKTYKELYIIDSVGNVLDTSSRRWSVDIFSSLVHFFELLHDGLMLLLAKVLILVLIGVLNVKEVHGTTLLLKY